MKKLLKEILNELKQINKNLYEMKRIEEFTFIEVDSADKINKKLEPYG